VPPGDERVGLAGELHELAPHDRVEQRLAGGQPGSEILHRSGEQVGVALGPEPRDPVVARRLPHRTAEVGRRRVAEVVAAGLAQAPGPRRGDRLPNVGGVGRRERVEDRIHLPRRCCGGERRDQQDDAQVRIGSRDAAGSPNCLQDRAPQRHPRRILERRCDGEPGHHEILICQVVERGLWVDIAGLRGRGFENRREGGRPAPASRRAGGRQAGKCGRNGLAVDIHRA
jgi:hypothetical protein